LNTSYKNRSIYHGVASKFISEFNVSQVKPVHS
jgi:hypothetical protein